MNRKRRRDHGQGLIEFAVIFPIFALMLFAVVDGGFLMRHFITVNGAVKEGARYGAVGASAGGIQTVVANNAGGALTGSRLAGNSVCVVWLAGPSGELPGNVGSLVKVSVVYHYKLITGLFQLWRVPKPDWAIKANAIQRVERPVAAPIPNCAIPPGPTNTPVAGTSTPTRTPAAGTATPTNTLAAGTATNTPGAATSTPTPIVPTPTPIVPTPTKTRTPVPTPTCTDTPGHCNKTATAWSQTQTATP